MKKIIIFLYFTTLISCSHKINLIDRERLPSSDNKLIYKSFSECGEVSLNESTYNTLNQEDVMYNLALDCNHDKIINSEDQFLSVAIPVEYVKPAQKGWITRFSKMARKANQSKLAKPYMCVAFQALENPCMSKRSVIGYNPQFTGRVENITTTQK